MQHSSGQKKHGSGGREQQLLPQQPYTHELQLRGAGGRGGVAVAVAAGALACQLLLCCLCWRETMSGTVGGDCAGAGEATVSAAARITADREARRKQDTPP
jgi:hypothetical protein